MLAALMLSLLTVAIGVTIHILNLSVVTPFLLNRLKQPVLRTETVVLVAAMSQVLVAGIFALAYTVGESSGLGGFKQPGDFTDTFYFSLTTITTLGLGSIEPTEHLRMLAGIESATGFLLISCSASTLFRTMQH